MNPNDNNQSGQTTPNDWQQMSDTNATVDPNLSTPVSLPGDNGDTNQMAQGYPSTNPMPTDTAMNDTQAATEPVEQTVGPVTTADGSEVIPRDPNVLNFMIQTVQEKHKEGGVDQAFVQKEAERLYDEFGEKLVDYFEPMLSKDQIEQFDKLMSEGTSQDQLLAFLMSCIPDLTQQIEKVLIEFKEKYIYGF